MGDLSLHKSRSNTFTVTPSTCNSHGKIEGRGIKEQRVESLGGSRTKALSDQICPLALEIIKIGGGMFRILTFVTDL